MNILVCVKQVPDTELQILPNEDNSDIKRDGIKYVINPYDEYAIEEALKIKEKTNDTTVTVISAGPESAKEIIRTALAMGCDEGILISTQDNSTEPLQVSKMLATFIKQKEYDLILAGKQAIDDDSASVAGAIAGILDYPQATNVISLEIDADEKKAKAVRQTEKATITLEFNLPAIITTEKGLNEPRYASLPGMMKAKKKEIPIIASTELFTTDEKSILKVIKITKPQEREAEHKIFEGEPENQIDQLLKTLKDAIKII